MLFLESSITNLLKPNAFLQSPEVINKRNGSENRMRQCPSSGREPHTFFVF